MAKTLDYTAEEINSKLASIDDLASRVSSLESAAAILSEV